MYVNSPGGSVTAGNGCFCIELVVLTSDVISYYPIFTKLIGPYLFHVRYGNI